MPRLKLPKWNRIYVNRSLNMASINCIGFDMDHTLVLYNRENFESLAFRETLKKFIDAGYPDELSRLEFDPDSVIRGLMVDRKRGNLLKVDAHKYVKVAMHGRTILGKQERHRLYNSESFRPQDFLSIDTFFALSEVQLFTEIVDYMQKNPGKISKTFEEVYQDLRTFIDLSHRDGSIKTKVLAEPDKYFVKDKFRSDVLVHLINGDKRIFLLTNSHYDYSNEAMSYLYNDADPDFSDWKQYFEYIIVASAKPGFFTGAAPFSKIANGGEPQEHSGPLETGSVYHGGNARLFQDLTNQKGDEILYVGDHIYGDIIRSKENLNWRTLLIVEELDKQLPILEELQPILEKIQTSIREREKIDEEAQRIRSRLRSNQRRLNLAPYRDDRKKSDNIRVIIDEHKEKLLVKEGELQSMEKKIRKLIMERDVQIHPFWGELMRVGLEKSRFARQVEGYACLYTGRVTNMRFYSPFKRFVSPHDFMPHEG